MRVVAATRLLRKGKEQQQEEEEEKKEKENNSSSVEARSSHRNTPRNNSKVQCTQNKTKQAPKKNKLKSPQLPRKPKPSSKRVTFVAISGRGGGGVVFFFFFFFSCAEISPLGDQKTRNQTSQRYNMCE